MSASNRATARHFTLTRRLVPVVALALSLIPSLSHAAPTVIDWSKGYVQASDANCGEMTFTHMRDHSVYTLWIRGAVSGTCSFQADGLTFLLPQNYGATTAQTKTLFSFARIGNEVIVAWTPGY
jgi:hypothetical protein